MATRALRRRTGEYSIRVAGLAVREPVCTLEAESGGEMIEARAGKRGQRYSDDKEKGNRPRKPVISVLRQHHMLSRSENDDVL